MAHIDAGKTTCAERVLFFTGRVRTPGEVHEGTAKLDHLPEEQRRGITITAAATTVSWTPGQGLFEGVPHRIQIIDTPGHIDFTIEVERSLRVLDGAVFVLDAGSGVECQSETVWRQAERHRVPRIAFINKTDKPGADVDMCVRELRERLGANPVQVLLPVDGGRVLLDVVRRVSIVFDRDDEGRTFRTEPIPEGERERVDQARARLIEACSEVDEQVLAGFCAGRDVASVDLERALRKGTLQGRLLVVLCGSALKNRGIQQLLDAVVAYLPSPEDLPPVEGTGQDGVEVVLRRPRDDEPLSALAFKTVSDKSAGFVTFLRVYSGILEAGQQVWVAPRGSRERVGRMFLLHADEREEIDVAHAGVIVAVTGLRKVRTGDTLCHPEHPVVLERIDAPEPVIEVAIEPRASRDRERLAEAMSKVLVEDPSIRVSTHQDTGQMILAGMGQLHLEIAVSRLLSEHKVEVTVGKPQVAYRETLGRHARAEYRHVRQSGGSGQFACVTLSVGPGERGKGVTFVDETTGGVVPREFVPGVEKGVRGAAARGVFAGYPVVDVEVRLEDGAFHSKDSSVQAFEIAGSLAFQRAAREAGAVLLEPMTLVEVTVPEEFTGAVVGDLSSRRGVVRGIATRSAAAVVTARAPLSSMFDWVSRLRGISSGRGTAVLKIDGHDLVPEALARSILERG